MPFFYAQNQRGKGMKRHLYDLALVGGCLLAALVLWLVVRPGGAGAWAVVTVDGEEVGRYALSQDKRLTIGEEDYNIVEISQGEAAVTEANCGDLTCVHTGRISREGETIVCLPHKLIVRIEGGEAQGVDIGTT
jgi:hypothetical protein